MSPDWPKVFKKLNYQVTRYSSGFKCKIYTLSIGEGLIKFDLSVKITEISETQYKFQVNITGKAPNNIHISNFKKNLCKNFRIINNSDSMNIFTVVF